MKAALSHYGFRQSPVDHLLFAYRKDGIHLYVLVYVDDLVIVGDHAPTIASFKTYLHSCFHMKYLGTLRYFLGIEIARNPEGLFLC